MANGWGTLGTAAAIIAGSSLNSLATNSCMLGSNSIASANTDFYGRVHLFLASADLSAQNNPACRIYWIKSDDSGTTYEDGFSGTTANEPARQPDVIIPFREVYKAQHIMKDCVIPAGYAKALIVNKTGAAFPAASNAVKLARYTT